MRNDLHVVLFFFLHVLISSWPGCPNELTSPSLPLKAGRRLPSKTPLVN